MAVRSLVRQEVALADSMQPTGTECASSVGRVQSTRLKSDISGLAIMVARIVNQFRQKCKEKRGQMSRCHISPSSTDKILDLGSEDGTFLRREGHG